MLRALILAAALLTAGCKNADDAVNIGLGIGDMIGTIISAVP